MKKANKTRVAKRVKRGPGGQGERKESGRGPSARVRTEDRPPVKATVFTSEPTGWPPASDLLDFSPLHKTRALPVCEYNPVTLP